MQLWVWKSLKLLKFISHTNLNWSIKIIYDRLNIVLSSIYNDIDAL